MTFAEIFILAGVGLFTLIILLWIVSLVLRDASIIDIFWGTGFVILNGIYFFLTPDGFLPRKLLLSLVVTVWGLRLSGYLLYRNWGQGEDYRYRRWRQNGGSAWWWKSFFRIFLLQAVLIWILSVPFLATQFSPTPDYLTALDFSALIAWSVGFFFEAVGDTQLARFRSQPENQGKLLTTGVWRYTRHPNYFGDALQWWAYFLFAASSNAYWTLYSPILMTVLLVRISGVALLEKDLRKSKPGYEEYEASTNAFLPWFPRMRVE